MFQPIPQPVIQDYYRDPAAFFNDVANPTVPLQVNCAGKEHYPFHIIGTSTRKDYYLLYVAEGAFTLDAPFHTVLHAGDLIIFDAGTPSGFHTHVEPPTTHCFAHFTGYAAGDLLRRCGLATSTVYTIDNRERLQSKFNALFQAFSFRDEVFDADAALKLYSLLVAVGRMQAVKKAPQPLHERRRLERTLTYIHENFTKEISVRELADMEFLSESRYRTLFTALLKQPPSEYIISLRMNAACEMLENSHVGIRQIALSVGYADQRYFARLFRSRYGVTPTEYRKRL